MGVSSKREQTICSRKGDQLGTAIPHETTRQSTVGGEDKFLVPTGRPDPHCKQSHPGQLSNSIPKAWSIPLGLKRWSRPPSNGTTIAGIDRVLMAESARSG